MTTVRSLASSLLTDRRPRSRESLDGSRAIGHTGKGGLERGARRVALPKTQLKFRQRFQRGFRRIRRAETKRQAGFQCDRVAQMAFRGLNLAKRLCEACFE